MTVDVSRADGSRDDVRDVPAGRGGDVASSGGDREAERVARKGFLRRYRLPLLLGVIALCLYAGSILYILYGRGQIA